MVESSNGIINIRIGIRKMSDFAVLTPTYEDCKSWLRQIMIEHLKKANRNSNVCDKI